MRLNAFILPALTASYLLIGQLAHDFPWLNSLATKPVDTQIADAAAPAVETPAPKVPIEERIVSIDKGDTLSDVLTDADVPQNEAQKAVAAIKKIFNVKALKHGQDIKLVLDNRGAQPKLASFSFTPDPTRTISANRKGDDFVGLSTIIPVNKKAQAAHGKITSSLAASARAAGVPAAALADMIHAYSYDVDFQRDLKKGDGFEVLFEQFVNANGQLVKTGNLLYASLTVDGKPMRIYRFDDGGRIDYYTENGTSIRKSLLKTPVDGARITSGFGMRMHPLLGYSKMHKGVDFGAPTGTPIFAAGDGMIDQANYFGSYGNYVRIRHNKDFSTAYAHMSRFAASIHKGASVRQGQVIGYVGTTGRSTGAHLHFEVIKDGSQINPTQATAMANNQLTGKQLAQFKSAIVQRSMQFAAITQGTPKVASAVGLSVNP